MDNLQLKMDNGQLKSCQLSIVNYFNNCYLF